MQVEIHQAVLEEAVRVAAWWEAERQVDAVVARGLTAWLIRQKLTRIPVVAIDVGGYDVMEALHRARQLGRKIAFIDYDYVRRPYDLDEIRQMLGVDFTPMLYTSRIGILRQVARARREGYEVIVSTGVLTNMRARRWNMRTVLVRSNPAAVRNALLQAEAKLRRYRSAEYRDKRAQAVVEASRDGVIALDPQGRVTIYNAAAERILGLPAQEVVGRPVREIRDPDFAVVYGGGAEATNEVLTVRGRECAVTRVPIQVAGQPAGLVITFQQASAILRLEEKIRRELHTKGLTARYRFEDILGTSPVLQEAIAKARKFARSDLTVLITGESGTGKELFAHAIHHYSPRAGGAFVIVNCAALPESLLESELFGYAEGAFTGAKKGGKPGLFELAHGGTIFLDEIGELPLPLQARLLRVLQSREVMRIGGDRLIPVNVRVVAATNRQLDQAVAEGRFRGDLYYRLSVLNLHVPPLRERPADIRILAEHFLSSGEEVGAPSLRLPDRCLDLLQDYPWMGNVRELRNFLMKFLILADGDPNPVRLFERLLEEEQGTPARRVAEPPQVDDEHLVVRLGTMEEMEQQILRQLERRPGLDRSEMARLLGISRTTLWKKLKAAAPKFKN